MPIEACTFSGHQIHPFHADHRRGMEQFFDHPAAQAMAAQITGHHDVPQHSAAEAIGAGTAKAHQPFATPEAHHGIAAGEQSAQLGKAAAPGPEGMAIKQPLQLEQRPAGEQVGP